MVILSVFFAAIVGFVCLILALNKFFFLGEIPIATTIILFICLISIVGTIIHNNNLSSETTWKELWRTNIVAMKDNSNVEGKLNGGIFITSGYVNEKMYYYCMKNTVEGKNMIKIPVENTYIIETNDIQPSIIKKSEKYIDKRYAFWMDETGNVKYTIYVPVGTVDATYKVDLE